MKKTKEALKTGLNALAWKEDNLFVTQCLEVDVASQGQTKKKALANLEEALELFTVSLDRQQWPKKSSKITSEPKTENWHLFYLLKFLEKKPWMKRRP